MLYSTPSGIRSMKADPFFNKEAWSIEVLEALIYCLLEELICLFTWSFKVDVGWIEYAISHFIWLMEKNHLLDFKMLK